MGFENGHLARVVLTAQHNSDGDEQVNVLHYDIKNSTDPDPTHQISLQALADRIRDDVIPHFKALYNSDWTILPVVVEDERDPLNPTAARSSATSGAAAAGTALEGDQLPRAMCFVATLKTDSIGRRHTGRMFVGGSNADADVGGDNWNSGALANVQTMLDAIPHQPDLITGVTTNTADWCVYSRSNRGADIDPYASHVQSTILRTRVHWLRSRAPR